MYSVSHLLTSTTPCWKSFCLDPRFNTLLNLAGADARLGTREKDGMVFNHYVNSAESSFTKMGWHTDGLRDIFQGTKLNPMLNLGIHLSTLKLENGGLRIIPGTHEQSLYGLLFRKRYFLDHNADKHEVAIIPQAGDLTIHDGRLWHPCGTIHCYGRAKPPPCDLYPHHSRKICAEE